MSLSSQIESLLFIAAKPLSAHQLAEFCAVKKEEALEASDALVESYKERATGLQVVKNGDKYQMVSSPENAAVVQAFVKDETTGDLSRPSLEALTIIAYRGPISKIDLDRIRGVNCALILRNLLLRGLIEAKPGKAGETRYVVTFDFIRFLGINDIRDLPEYERLHQDDTIDRVLKDPEEGAEGAKSSDMIQEEGGHDQDDENPEDEDGEDDEDEYDDEDEDEEEGGNEDDADDSDGATDLEEGDTVVVIETTDQEEGANDKDDEDEEEEEDVTDEDEDEEEDVDEDDEEQKGEKSEEIGN